MLVRRAKVDHLVGIITRSHYAAPMSMLTPPGMGGKYRITGNTYPACAAPAIAASWSFGDRRRGGPRSRRLGHAPGHRRLHRRRRTGQRAAKPKACPSPSASTPAKVLPKPAAIKVNIYNATPRSGLAKAAADELKKRGFAIGRVDNAPAAYDKKVPGTGMLLGGPDRGRTAPSGARHTAAGGRAEDRHPQDGGRRSDPRYEFKAFSAPRGRRATASHRPSPAPAPARLPC